MKKRSFLKLLIAIVLFSMALASCKYMPFVKYYRLDKETNLPKFNKYSKLAGSNNSHRSCYDVTRYDWEVDVDPEKKRISGKMEIWMDVTSTEDSLIFDLNHALKIDSISCRKGLTYKRKRDLVYVIFTEDLEKDSQLELTFYYNGKPPNILNEGPIVWKEDSNGKPWFSTQTEGLGVGCLFPCKDLLIDEPEDCFIRVTVPDGLKTACNGKLIESVSSEGKTTTSWHVDNSINIYNISFNVGDFETFEIPYESVNGNAYNLEFYVLKENLEKAKKFYSQTPEIMKAAEELFGEYPWWNDGLKFVESTFSAMEHQGCIAMGSYYELDWEAFNSTLIHEIAHEWWGNSMTASDYGDIWLHEGLATYSENLVIERIYGIENYLTYCRNQMFWGIMNKRPIQKTPEVRYTSWAAHADGDIYSKGAMLMHTLRTQMENDSLFMKILKDIQVEYRDRIISSDEFQAYFLSKCECDFEVFFDVMLRQSRAPELAYSIFIEEDGSNPELKFKWTNSVPRNYPMKIKFVSGEKEYILEPTYEEQVIKLLEGGKHYLRPWHSGYFVTVPYE